MFNIDRDVDYLVFLIIDDILGENKETSEWDKYNEDEFDEV